MNSIFSVLLFTLCSFTLALSNKHNIIVSNYELCAGIGRDIITEDRGNGFDAAIGVMLCEGVAKPQDMGLGGGFFGIIKKKGKEPFVINSRERCPVNLNKDSFKHEDSNKIFGKTIGVPSAISGYYYLHKNHGKTKWVNIVKRVYHMCLKGFPVTIGEVLNKKQYEYLEETHRNIFINKETELPYANNETWKRPDLAATMLKLMKFGPRYFNTKAVRTELKNEINSFGGNITDIDFNIKPVILKPYVKKFIFGKNKYKLYTTPLPGGGPSLVFILKIMETFYKNYPKHTLEERYFVLIEAIKFAFSYRTEFGDPKHSDMEKILKTMNSEETLNKILKRIVTSKQTHEDSDCRG